MIAAQGHEERGDDDDGQALEKTQDFYRLFMVPGMVHCNGGPGPNSFGNAQSPPPPVKDAEHDAMLALIQWVEQGIPPDRIIATHYVNHDSTQGIDMQRPLCPYPGVARYTGTGDTTNAANFVCVGDEPDRLATQGHPDQ